ncbi:hypothetical protein HDV00_002599 [Rhizophlyctis rosea]|nr:hypothetical protein HDV00_002599 [Rhizophlyctis rosea]
MTSACPSSIAPPITDLDEAPPHASLNEVAYVSPTALDAQSTSVAVALPAPQDVEELTTLSHGAKKRPVSAASSTSAASGRSSPRRTKEGDIDAVTQERPRPSSAATPANQKRAPFFSRLLGRPGRARSLSAPEEPQNLHIHMPEQGQFDFRRAKTLDRTGDGEVPDDEGDDEDEEGSQLEAELEESAKCGMFLPRTLTGASEDINHLLDIAAEGSIEPRSRGRDGSSTRTEVDYREGGEFDINSMMSVGQAEPKHERGTLGRSRFRRVSENVAKTLSKSREALSELTSPQSSVKFQSMAMVIDIEDSGRPVEMGPVDATSPVVASLHPMQTLRAAAPLLMGDTQIDIDEMLAVDPNPNEVVVATFPRVVGDVDDVLQFSARLSDARPLAESPANASSSGSSSFLSRKRATSAGALAGKWHSTPTLLRMESGGSTSMLAGILTSPRGTRGPPPSMLNPQNVEQSIQDAFPYITDHTTNAPDINDIISVASPAQQSENQPPASEPLTSEHDIERLMRVGEQAKEAMYHSKSATLGRRQSDERLRQTDHPAPPSSKAVLNSTGLPADRRHRVSFTAQDVAGVEIKVSTRPTLGVIDAVTTGIFNSMDIDEYLISRKQANRRLSAASARTSTKALDDQGSNRDIQKSGTLDPTDNTPTNATSPDQPLDQQQQQQQQQPQPRPHSQITKLARPRSVSNPEHRPKHPITTPSPQRVTFSPPGKSSPTQQQSPRMPHKGPHNKRLASMDISSFIDLADVVEQESTSPHPAQPKVTKIETVERAESVDIGELLDMGKSKTKGKGKSAADTQSPPSLDGAEKENDNVLATRHSHDLDSTTLPSSHLLPLSTPSSSTDSSPHNTQKRRYIRSVEHLISKSGSHSMGQLPQSSARESKRQRRSMQELGERTLSEEVRREEVEMRRIDIDELLCWGAELRARIDRRFSVRTAATGSSGAGTQNGSTLLGSHKSLIPSTERLGSQTS